MRTPVPPALPSSSIHIGCDVHAVAETAASIARFGDSYLRRVFTPHELRQTQGVDAAERLASRFAAKEAVAKVLRVPRDTALPWNTIEVHSPRHGAPSVVLTGVAAALANELHIDSIEVSLSHDAGVAMAVAAAVPRPAEGPEL